MAQRIKTWFLATRPQTLLASLSPVLIGSAYAYNTQSFHLSSGIYIFLSALCIQIGTNLANDYFDHRKGADTSERLGPMRMAASGLITPKALLIATCVVLGLAFLFGIPLMIRGGAPIVLIGCFSLLFAVLYTGGPYPLAYNGLGDLFVFIFFGPVAVCGTFYVHALSFSYPVLWASIAPGLLATAILLVNNIRDENEDKKNQKNTLIVHLGAVFGRFLYSFCIFCSFYLFFTLLKLSAISGFIGGMLGVASIALVYQIWSFRGTELNVLLKITAFYLFIFSTLFSALVLAS